MFALVVFRDTAGKNFSTPSTFQRFVPHEKKETFSEESMRVMAESTATDRKRRTLRSAGVSVFPDNSSCISHFRFRNPSLLIVTFPFLSHIFFASARVSEEQSKALVVRNSTVFFLLLMK